MCQGSGRVESPEMSMWKSGAGCAAFISIMPWPRSLVLSVHPLVEEWIRIHGMKDMEQEFGAKIRLVSNPSLAVGVFTLLNAPDGD